MEFYGATGKEKTFYTQYLTDINQRVLLHNSTSHTFSTSKRPQIH
jgi:predicted GIY-YIG superfamily endonuclease